MLSQKTRYAIRAMQHLAGMRTARAPVTGSGMAPAWMARVAKP